MNKITSTRDYENDSIENRTMNAFNDTSNVIMNVCDPIGTNTSAVKCSIDQGLTKISDNSSAKTYNFRLLGGKLVSFIHES